METVFVAVEEGNDSKILGWVSGAPASHRPAFHGVLEDSIYLHPDAQGRGVSGALLDKAPRSCMNPVAIRRSARLVIWRK